LYALYLKSAKLENHYQSFVFNGFLCASVLNRLGICPLKELKKNTLSLTECLENWEKLKRIVQKSFSNFKSYFFFNVKGYIKNRSEAEILAFIKDLIT